MPDPTSNVVNFIEERLIRLAPDYPLALADEDFAYIETCLEAVNRVFPPLDSSAATAKMSAPLHLLPVRALMRRLINLRRELTPRTAEQRLAYGMLWGALGLLNTARAMAAERSAAKSGRR